MSDESTFLFARPSFIEGISRVMDFGANLQIYNDCATGEDADTMALQEDWEAIGGDISSAVREYEQ